MRKTAQNAVFPQPLSYMRQLSAYLDEDQQIALVGELAKLIEVAPFFRPTLPRWGTPFSVMMSNCGEFGWVSDKSGYRYQPTHPDTGERWPGMPQMLLDIWDEVAGYPQPPEACLINHYTEKAKMGLHQDRDEEDFDAPVLSISLGDDARFRLGGLERKGPTESFVLKSGDVMTLEGESRLAFHGIDRLFPGTSDLLSGGALPGIEGGRINLTLRRVSRA